MAISSMNEFIRNQQLRGINTMNKLRWLTASFLLINSIHFQALAEESDGVIRIKSMHNVAATADKLGAVLVAKGMTLFKRISHSDGAAKAG